MRTFVQPMHNCSGEVEECQSVPQEAAIPLHKPGAQ